MTPHRPLLGCLLLALAAGCDRTAATAPDADAASTPAWFEDVTDRVGIDFVHDPGPTDDRHFLPGTMGSGCALFDFDGEGRLGILLLQNGGPDSAAKNKLYRQVEGGKFEDVSAGSGLDFAGWNMGVAVGDVNNDGLPDLLITQYGGARLFLNLGRGKFRDVSKEAGLDVPGWCSSAAFLDYDRDGRLDLVIVRYLNYNPATPCTSPNGAPDYCNPSGFRGSATALFHNATGPDGRPRFEDVTLSSGLGRVTGPGLGVVCADFDGDGWPDVFIANDGKPNHLWINQKDGTFKEEAVRCGIACNTLGLAQAGMGVAVGDVDGDGLEDVFVTHLAEETNTLWVQGPRGLFRDRTGPAGLTAPRWRGTGFGTVLADFDLDGALDLAIVNGGVRRGGPAVPGASALGPYWSAYAGRNQLFQGDGAGHFRDISPSQTALCGYPTIGRGLAVGDVDGDGAPDLLVTSAEGKARLLLNRAPNRGHWLTVRALDGKRDATGAEVTVRAGGRCWLRRADPAGGYLCSGDPRALFGLGAAAEVEPVSVRWPDGSAEEYPGGQADRALVVRKGEGKRP
ncbi:MAG TPA: CRTAC1 family protein [Gemmataceae bacterium]|nr:CRTAC1 family protein [Gemmataceae bacterium]